MVQISLQALDAPCLQNFISVVIVSILSSLGLISTEPLTWRLVKVWLPVNVIFVGMLVTSMFRYETCFFYGHLGECLFDSSFKYSSAERIVGESS